MPGRPGGGSRPSGGGMRSSGSGGMGTRSTGSFRPGSSPSKPSGRPKASVTMNTGGLNMGGSGVKPKPKPKPDTRIEHRPTPPPPPPPRHEPRPPRRDYSTPNYGTRPIIQTTVVNTGNTSGTYRGSYVDSRNNDYELTRAREQARRARESERQLRRTCYTIIACVVILAFIFVVVNVTQNNSNPTSTIVRSKLEDTSFTSSCIIDELEFFENVNRAGTQLKPFWQKTGIQPYYITTSYNPFYITDAEREDYVRQWYDDNIDNEWSLVIMYFEEEDPYEIGSMSYAAGHEVDSIMDAEAVSIMWSYFNRYWETDLSMDDMVAKSLNETADVIMHVSTTGKDIVKYIIIAFIVIVIIVAIFSFMIVKRKHEAERAAETERILNASLESLKSGGD